MHVCVSVFVCVCGIFIIAETGFARTHTTPRFPSVLTSFSLQTDNFFIRILDDVNHNCKKIKIKIYQNTHLVETALNHFVIHNVSNMTKAPVFKDSPYR